MNLNQITCMLASYKKGTYKSIVWERHITLKDGSVVTKKTKAIARFNINYGNMASVKEKPQDGTKEYKPTEWLIKNVVKVTSTGKNVLMVYTTLNGKNKTIVDWYDANGHKINKSDIEELMYAKDKKSYGNEQITVMNININDVVRIG